MVVSLARRELRGRYKGSVFGFLWNFFIPLVQMVVYVIVFSQLFKHSIENFSVFFLAAMAEWIFISDALSAGAGEIVANGDMLGKIYFPRSVLPISIIIAKLVNYLITLGVIVAIIGLLGHGFSLFALLYLPIMIALMVIFITGVVLVLSSIDAYFRDVQYIVTVMLAVLFWITPIIYDRSEFDSSSLLGYILMFNPLTYFIESFRDIFYYQCAPSATNLVICSVLAFVSIIAGSWVFRHLEKNFAEVL